MKNIVSSFHFLFFILNLSLAKNLFAQSEKFVFPIISKRGNTLNDFVPSKWKIRDTVSCDFNKDNYKDLAIVIETIDSVKTPDSCFSREPHYAKMLLIVFKQPDGSYRLSETATKFFGECNWGIQEQDAYERIFIRNNTLGIDFLTGGTLRILISYFFEYRKSDWYLIGASDIVYQQGTTEVDFEDINLITGLREIYIKDSEKNRKTGLKKNIVEHRKLIKLKDFEDESRLSFFEGL